MRKIFIEDEIDLHKLLQEHPEIVFPHGECHTIKREIKNSNSTRIKLELNCENKKYILEIKNRKIKRDDLLQAIRYKIEAAEKAEVILIGKKPKEEILRESEKWGIKIITLGEEIPKTIKICESCRKAYNGTKDKCPYCNNTTITQIYILK